MSSWSEIYLGQLRLDPDFKLNIPLEALPGEDSETTTIRYFLEQGIFVETSPGIYDMNEKRAEEVDPNIAKLIAAFKRAEFAEVMEMLELDGYVYMTLDDAGDFRYALTPEGVQYLEQSNSKDN